MDGTRSFMQVVIVQVISLGLHIISFMKKTIKKQNDIHIIPYIATYIHHYHTEHEYC